MRVAEHVRFPTFEPEPAPSTRLVTSDGQVSRVVRVRMSEEDWAALERGMKDGGRLSDRLGAMVSRGLREERKRYGGKQGKGETEERQVEGEDRTRQGAAEAPESDEDAREEDD